MSNQEIQDKVVWVAEEGEVFLMKSTYEVIHLSMSSMVDLGMEILGKLKLYLVL